MRVYQFRQYDITTKPLLSRVTAQNKQQICEIKLNLNLPYRG